MLRSSHQAAGAPLASRACGPWPIPVESVVSVAPRLARAEPGSARAGARNARRAGGRALEDRRDPDAPAREPARRADRGAPLGAGGVRLPRRRERCATSAGRSRVPPSKVFGVATFYHYFTLKPQRRAHLRRLHRHRLLHQRRRRDPGAIREAVRRRAGRDDRGRPALAADGALLSGRAASRRP